MTSTSGDRCHPCAQEADLAAAGAGERVWVGTYWRVAHAIDCALPGWLVVVPRRHTTAIADHTVTEAAELGSVLVASSQALQRVTGCRKTYVAQFAEADGFAHTHFHVVPRMDDLPPDRLGSGIFWYLGRPPSEHVPASDRDRLAGRLAAEMAAILAPA